MLTIADLMLLSASQGALVRVVQAATPHAGLEAESVGERSVMGPGLLDVGYLLRHEHETSKTRPGLLQQACPQPPAKKKKNKLRCQASSFGHLAEASHGQAKQAATTGPAICVVMGSAFRGLSGVQWPRAGQSGLGASTRHCASGGQLLSVSKRSHASGVARDMWELGKVWEVAVCSGCLLSLGCEAKPGICQKLEGKHRDQEVGRNKEKEPANARQPCTSSNSPHGRSQETRASSPVSLPSTPKP